MKYLWIPLFLLFAGCVDTEPEPVDNGVEATFEQVDQVFRLAIGDDSVGQIQQGEFIAITQNQIIASSPRQILKTQGLEISKKEYQEDGGLELTIVEQTIDNTGNQEKRYIREHFVSIAGNDVLPEPDSENATDPGVQRLIKRSAIAPTLRTQSLTPRRFYNLKSVRAVEDPPPAVKNSEDCRGLNPCKVNVTNVSFDMVMADDYNNEFRLGVFLKIASNVPYTARELTTCQEFVLRIDFADPGDPPQYRAVPIRECFIVEDFHFGQNNSN